MTATIFFLSGAGLIVFALGVFAGIWLGRLGDRPAVTAWGEHTGLWSETDWYWYEHCGRFSDTDMVGKIRRYSSEIPATSGPLNVKGMGTHPDA